MSHTTTIKGVAISDAEVMARAVRNLQNKGVSCSLIENATPRMYYRSQEAEVGVCDYVLKLPGAKYDVGFKKQEDGTFAPILDEWANSVAGQIGAGSCFVPQTAEEKSMWSIGQFSQEYAKEAAIKAASRQGYNVQSSDIDADGNVNLVLASGF